MRGRYEVSQNPAEFGSAPVRDMGCQRDKESRCYREDSGCLAQEGARTLLRSRSLLVRRPNAREASNEHPPMAAGSG